MKVKSRVQSSIRNVYFSLITQFVTIVLNYACRYVFIKKLSEEYLGVNGLFSNILTVFSLAELGIGSAIVYAMYKPIADNNIKKIKAYMAFYKKCYSIIAIVILILGLILLPNLSFFIKGDTYIPHLKIIYLLYLADSVFSYLFVYKTAILNSMQENYICNLYQTICKVIMSILMIISLIVFRNFIIYLIIQVMFKLITNILISRKADEKYPYIKNTVGCNLSKKEEKTIFKNVYALFCNQIGNVLINGTDNIIISKYVGLIAVGLYSNYYLVTSTLSNFIGQVFNAIVASVGNLAAEKDSEYVYGMFNKIHFINFVISAFCIVVLSCTINDFIAWSFGKKFVLNSFIVVVILINFYLLVMKNVVGTFKYALGIFLNDKYCTLIRAIINIVVSIILAKSFGIFGVFFGTFISDILTTFWYQPYILYKKGFSKSVSAYFKDFGIYTLISLIGIGVSLGIKFFINFDSLFLNIILDLFISSAVILLLILLMFHKSENFQFFYKIIINRFKKNMSDVRA